MFRERNSVTRPVLPSGLHLAFSCPSLPSKGAHVGMSPHFKVCPWLKACIAWSECQPPGKSTWADAICQYDLAYDFSGCLATDDRWAYIAWSSGTFNQWRHVCHRKLPGLFHDPCAITSRQPQPANDSLALGRGSRGASGECAGFKVF